MDQEQWRPIPGFDGFYEVSDQGRVRSIERTILVKKTGSPSYSMTFSSKILTASLSGAGYRSVTLWKQGIGAQRQISRLVLIVFAGPAPSEIHACHNNGCKTDDRLSNLRWGTPKDNNADKRVHGTHLQGEECHSAKLTRTDVLGIREASGTQKQIAAMFGVSQPHVGRIRNRREWAHVK